MEPSPWGRAEAEAVRDACCGRQHGGSEGYTGARSCQVELSPWLEDLPLM